MNNHHFNELGNIQAAFSILRQFNQYVLFPVSDKVFENPILVEYFDSPLGSPIEKKVEKIICTAATKAVFDNPNIPKSNKARSARNTSRDILEALQYSKTVYHAQAKGLSHREYMRRIRSLSIVKRAAKIKMAKKVAKNLTITAFATLIAGPIGGSVAFGGRFIWKFLPEKIKVPIKKAAERTKEVAIKTIENCCDYIKSTKIGKKIDDTIKKISPVISRIEEKIRHKAQIAIDYLKSYWPY